MRKICWTRPERWQGPWKEKTFGNLRKKRRPFAPYFPSGVLTTAMTMSTTIPSGSWCRGGRKSWTMRQAVGVPPPKRKEACNPQSTKKHEIVHQCWREVIGFSYPPGIKTLRLVDQLLIQDRKMTPSLPVKFKIIVIISINLTFNLSKVRILTKVVATPKLPPHSRSMIMNDAVIKAASPNASITRMPIDNPTNSVRSSTLSKNLMK